MRNNLRDYKKVLWFNSQFVQLIHNSQIHKHEFRVFQKSITISMNFFYFFFIFALKKIQHIWWDFSVEVWLSWTRTYNKIYKLKKITWTTTKHTQSLHIWPFFSHEKSENLKNWRSLPRVHTNNIISDFVER